ncbi:hypothetical protein ES702_06706 [subsurface metagenome]
MLNYLKKSKTILGLNERNLKYIKIPVTEIGHSIPDNKLKTKKLLRKANIPVPKTYKIIRNQKDLKLCNWNKLANSFVIKPNLGTLGRGILIVFGKKKKKKNSEPEPENKTWVQADKKVITVENLENHILKILDGVYSYTTTASDIAFFEERLKIHPNLKPYCSRGIPDVRIIIYNKIPVMAELRLPTPESQGRANLHLGGIGVGVDMSTGVTTARGVWHKKLIDYLPERKRLPLSGIKIPFWKEMLELAIKTQMALKIDYLGIDIAIDRDKGLIVVEANTRPGLEIQIANLAPLKPRLEKAEGIKIKTTKQAVRLTRDMFGGEIEEELEEISGKKVIGITEPVEIIDRKEKKHSFIAKIDTGILKTQIQKEIVRQLKLKKKNKEEKPVALFSFIMDGLLVETEASIIDDPQIKYEIIIGKKDLKKFLIDPTKVYLKSKKMIRKKV